MMIAQLSKIPLTAMAALTLAGGVQAANLMTNGSFEAVPFTRNGNYSLALTDADVPGWHIPHSNGTYPWGLQAGAFGTPAPADGIQWVVLGLHSDPNTKYSIEQTLTGLSLGATYTLSFAIASELDCCAQAQVSFVGSSTAAQDFSAPSSGNYWTEWGYHSMNFVADASSVTISFAQINASTNGYDLGLDDVSVMAVPEPSTYALMLAGIAAIGTLVRSRRTG